MPNSRHEGPADYLGNIVEGNIDDRSNKGSDSMGWDEVERSWNELKGEVKRQWSKLTDEDVEIIKGKYAQLLGLLQERYGHAKEQAEREINDWARRLKVESAAELTALRDDVASLSASVGDLVRRQAAATSGLDQTLAASKLKLEEKANEAVDHIKGGSGADVSGSGPRRRRGDFCPAGLHHRACGLLRVAGARLWSITGAWYRWRGSGCDRVGFGWCRDVCGPRENNFVARSETGGRHRRT